MKATNKISALLLMLCLAWQSNAQTAIGFRVGLNLADVQLSGIADDIQPNTEAIIGSNFALVAEIGITDNFAIQPELNYITRGAKISQGIDLDLFGASIPLGASAMTRINFLDLPVLAKYKFGSEKVNGYLTAGPVFGYALNARLETKANFLVEIPIYDTDINLNNDNINRFEFAGSLGAGVSFNTSAGNFFVDARYTHGFSQMDNISLVDLKLKNKGFGISVGYMIPL